MHITTLLTTMLLALGSTAFAAPDTTEFPVTFTHTIVVEAAGTGSGQGAVTTVVPFVHTVTLGD